MKETKEKDAKGQKKKPEDKMEAKITACLATIDRAKLKDILDPKR